jgi:hypothetical protein
MPFVRQQKTEVVDKDERKQERDCSGLIQQLADSNPTARRWAARDLLECPDIAGVLVEHLHWERDPSVRDVIFTTLTRLGNEIAVLGLVTCLRSEDVALRNEAIEAMKHLPEEVAPIIRNLLADPVSDVRIFAVNILESLRHPQVEEWLVEVIDRDSHLNVCGSALDLLGEVGTGHSIAALQRLKERFPEEPYIQFATDLALKRIGKA